jgi:DNA primase
VRQTVVRDLLTLVLQHPRLAHIAHDVESLKELDAPGIGLLVDVIHTVVQSSGLTTAGLLERFRGHEHHRHLEKLAARAHITAEDRLEDDFRWLLTRLKVQLVDQRINELKDRSRQQEAQDGRASESVKKQLDTLLKTKRELQIRGP